MHAAIVPTNSIRAYMTLDDVELRHEGHAEQHKEQAVLPQQHASCKSIKIVTRISERVSHTGRAEHRPRTAPISHHWN